MNWKYSWLIYGMPLSSVDHVASAWSVSSEGYGFKRSLVEGKCVGRSGDPIPWISYPAMEYLSALDFSSCRIFEYGAGASTLWWAKRAAQVVSVESDRVWVEKLRPDLPPNCHLIFHDGETARAKYVSAIEGQFDCIIVDGLGGHGARYECCTTALEHLKPGGLIVLDNADWLPRSCELLRQRGLLQVDFNGLVPLSEHAGRTSIFFSQPFLIPYGVHRASIAGISDNWETELGSLA